MQAMLAWVQCKFLLRPQLKAACMLLLLMTVQVKGEHDCLYEPPANLHRRMGAGGSFPFRVTLLPSSSAHGVLLTTVRSAAMHAELPCGGQLW